MQFKPIAAAAAALAFVWTAAPGSSQAASCEIDKPIVFAGLDWDSNSFHVAVAQFIMKNGYGCEVDKIPGSTIPMLNGMIRGDIDVTMEMWVANVKAAWDKALAGGKVVDLGINFPDAVQGWYVPKYLTEGANAPAKGLKSVADLPKFKDVFADPEEPGKGRFYNCIAGWGCEVINTKKMNAYGLNDTFVNFRPGTGAALSAVIESSIKRKKPIVFYYWGPTWVLGKVGDQVRMLDEPAYDQAIWDAMMDEKDETKVTKATAYPLVPVSVSSSSEFYGKAPKLVAFLKKYATNADMVSKALAYMQDTGGTAEEAAVNFLKTNEALWSKWLPADVAVKVKAAL
ncbi:MAG: ABC transporter substrate-binding protein [Rhodospirillales bacterium]|nr:ABC transporter substrate-binding protein [Rhodospirillales bacterium]